MTIFLFFLFAIAIFGIMLILTVINGITSFLFGKRNTSPNFRDQRNSHEGYGSYNDMDKSSKKVFSKEEGEYVKFEEIKE